MAFLWAIHHFRSGVTPVLPRARDSAMKTQRISKRMIDHLKPTAKEYAVFDSDIPGFGFARREP